MNLSPLPIQKFFGNDGQPLVGGKLFTYLSGTSTKVATYTDSGGLTQNTNPVVLDYRGECRLWIDPQQSYTFVLAPATDTDPPTAPIWTVNAITAGPVSQDNAATDTGSVNNIALSIPQISSPVAFTRIVFKVAYTNTGATTITINGGTSKNLRYQNTAAFAGGDIIAGGIYEAVFDGTQWQLLDPAVVYWRTAAEIAAGVTPVNYAYKPGHIYRYGTNTTPGTTDMTAAIQAAFNANNVVYAPSDTLSFTSFTWKFRRSMYGEGPRNTVFQQASSMNGSSTPAITWETGKPPSGYTGTDISDGVPRMDGFAVIVASQTGFYCDDDSLMSMYRSDQVRIWSRQAAINSSLPYSVIAGQRGIWVEAGGVTSAFMANHTNLEIRAFETGIECTGGVNEWKIDGWIIDCKYAVALDGCSTWDLSGVTVETGVQNARALKTTGSVSNVTWDGGRWEMTQSGCYGVEGVSSTGSNWWFKGINVLIASDGSAIPGRKWTGDVPTNFVFMGVDTVGPFVIIPDLASMRLPNSLLVGGSSLGNGSITIGRNAGGADSTIVHDGTHLVITGGNSVKIRGDGTATDRMEVNGTRVLFPSANASSNYQNAIALGSSGYLWVDSAGKLRIKTSAPTSDTDGTIVGTQT